jgi:DNA polymerase V
VFPSTVWAGNAMLRSLVGFGDADAFYSSAEVVRRPWLSGVPVGVLGNQGACVIARSYSMKRCGVKVGEPIWEAREKCPDGVYVKRDFRWYETISRRMLAEVGRFSPTVEYFSVDEFFWNGESTCSKDSALTIRDHIKESVGMPMTVAFARTRTLAKLFADTAKPFGAVVVTDRDHERELLAKLPVTEIAGIARRRAARLEPHGIRTCLELADASGLRWTSIASACSSPGTRSPGWFCCQMLTDRSQGRNARRLQAHPQDSERAQIGP